ncbi:MAG: DUF2927 domain-containing protein [Pseudomonadota bacterium]
MKLLPRDRSAVNDLSIGCVSTEGTGWQTRKLHSFVGVAAACLMVLAMSLMTPALAQTSQAQIIRGFNATVFGSEYTPGRSQTSYVRKFTREVRVHIDNRSTKDRRGQAQRFLLGLNRDIRNMRLRIVRNRLSANFRLIIVDQSQYERTVQRDVYGDRATPVRGRCIVRSFFTRQGIQRAVAVVVSDRGERLFRRCLIEETLQGLGPLNEDRRLMQSVFNDASHQTSFTRFDRLIMNMLYDPLLPVGTIQSRAQALLPQLYRRAVAYVDR